MNPGPQGAGSLTVYRRAVRAMADLLPDSEIGLTFLLGFTCARVPQLRRTFLRRAGWRWSSSAVNISLEEREDRGRTDLSFSDRSGHRLTVEAKRGDWPTRTQLEKYLGDSKIGPIPMLAALGAPSTPLRLFVGMPNGAEHEVTCVRWVEVLEMARDAELHSTPEAQEPLRALATKIEEALSMQTYNREVLVRAVNLEGEHSSWSYPLFMEHSMYLCAAPERSEPLFFAPCFTRAAVTEDNGVHYFSRVYCRQAVPDLGKVTLKAALERAGLALEGRPGSESARRRTNEALSDLPKRWKKGVKLIGRQRLEAHEHVLFFLGPAIRLPRRVVNRRGMIPRGFSSTLEELFTRNELTA